MGLWKELKQLSNNFKSVSSILKGFTLGPNYFYTMPSAPTVVANVVVSTVVLEFDECCQKT